VGTTIYIAIVFKANSESNPVYTTRNLQYLEQKHVLILDSNIKVRKNIAGKCHNWGMFPKTTQTTVEAFEHLKNDSGIKFAILDLDLIEDKHPKFIRELRTLEGKENFPLVLMSSKNVAEIPIESDNTVLLKKQVKHSELFKVLVKLSIESGLPISNPTKLSPKRDVQLLIVEDNSINQKLIQRTIDDLDIEWESALNGLQAVEMTRKKNYDIILMDLQMPIMGGVEATRNILKTADPKHHPKIIAMTANVQKEDKEMCFEAGMVDYVTKPINFDKMKYVIEYWGTVE